MVERAVLPRVEAVEQALGGPLDASLQAHLVRYLELLLEANERAGLTSLRDPGAIVERHFAESVALGRLLREHEWTRPRLEGQARLVDLGPGGGFPGVPMRLVDPRLRLTLVESHGRRAAFLGELCAALGLDDVEVRHARAETAGRDPAFRGAFDIVTARAVAPLAVLAEYALPLLRPGGVLLTPKGSGALEELEEATAALELLGGEAALPIALPHVEGVRVPTVVLVRRTEQPLDERFPRRPGIPSKRPLGVRNA